MKTHPLEAAREVELALHHVEEDGDGGLSQLDLRDQRHLQDGTHHLWDEFYLVGPLKEEGKKQNIYIWMQSILHSSFADFSLDEISWS